MFPTIRDVRSAGYLPLRHEDSNFDVSARNVAMGCRVGGTTDFGFGKGFNNLGQIVGETTVNGSKNTFGDLSGWGLWDANTRSIPAWSVCYPATITTVGPPIKAKPVWKQDYSTDTRFAEIVVTLPTGAAVPSMGAFGLVVFGTNEYNQENLFFPVNGGSGGGGFAGIGNAWYGDGSDGALTFDDPTLTPGGPFFDGSGGSQIGGAAQLNEYDFCVGPIGHFGDPQNGTNVFDSQYLYDLDHSPGDGLIWPPGNTHASAYPQWIPGNWITQIPNGTFLHFLTRPVMATSITTTGKSILVPSGFPVYCQGTTTGIISMDGDVAAFCDIFSVGGMANGGFTAAMLAGGAPGSSPSGNGSNGNIATTTPNNEGLAGPITGPNTGLRSGDGGNANAFTGGTGVQGGYKATATIAGQPNIGGGDRNGHPVRSLMTAAVMADSRYQSLIATAYAGSGLTIPSQFQGGSSGAGGAADYNTASPGGTITSISGGAGGYGGGVIHLRTRSIGSLQLYARGGNGYNAQPDGFATIPPLPPFADIISAPNAAGGGGGGNGGFCVLISEDTPFNVVLSAADFGAGNGGAYMGSGNTGSPGGAAGSLYWMKPIS
jgi:hypothetical protein